MKQKRLFLNGIGPYLHKKKVRISCIRHKNRPSDTIENMNRSWIQAPRINDEYEKGVEDFLLFAQQHAPMFGGKYFYPCVNCVNGRHHSLDDIRSHLICDGFSRSYTNWIWHSELPDMSTTADIESQHVQTEDRMEDMIRDLRQEGFLHAHAPYCEELQTDSKLPLYLGCTTYTRLSAVLALVNLKARFRWSDKSLTDLLVLLKNMLPNENTLPKSHYEAKKILRPVGMEYQKIHACRNNCILYRNEFAKIWNCPTCGVSRYKVNDGENNYEVGTNNNRPAKVCWYLPIIPRFKRLFASANELSNLKWHAFGRINDGLLRHAADSPQWKTIDHLYPEFGAEPRNLQLALASDDMNPFGNLNTSHSSWPIMLMIYNLPPWLCMKRVQDS